MAISWGKFVEVARFVHDRSLSLGIPAISFTDGLILASLTFTYCSLREYVRVVDAGAGIGFSTLFLAYGMSSGCKGELIAIEYVSERFRELEFNSKLVGEITGGRVKVSVVKGEALEYLRSVEDESLDVAFIDIEKRDYPEALRILKWKLRVGGLAVFHNAIYPRPPHEFFEIAEREFKSIIIPSEAGLLLAYKMV